MRVRTFELRLVAVGLTGLWFLAALYVDLGYRPGGPIDGVVGGAATLPMVIALAAAIWPPVARGERTFAAITWLGLVAGLLLVPSIGGVLNQLLGRGSQTLLPSVEAAYPWLLALAATSLFAGLGIARRMLGGASMRRTRLVRGVLIGAGLTVVVGSLFASVAIANELALRDRPAVSSRFGPTAGDHQPPPCNGPIAVGATALLELDLSAAADGRSVGAVGLSGLRAGLDVRWTADVASGFQLGRFGAARLGTRAWTRQPGRGWTAADPRSLDDQLIDAQVLATALDQGNRAAAENRGVEFVEGARGRRCRVAVDGPTFLEAFPQARWLIRGGEGTLQRWRGQLDYWVFVDGEIGQVAGNVSGPAAELGVDGIQGMIRAQLQATDRDEVRPVTSPSG